MSEFLCIDIKKLDDGGFQFCQTALIRKVLEATGMDHCNGLPTPTKVEALLGKYTNSYEVKRYWTNSYVSVIGMMLYLESDTRTDISFTVHQCAWFTHKIKASNNTAVKRICLYIQDTKENCLVFNQSKKLVADCYADTYFSALWGHKKPQEPICARSRTEFVAIADLSSPFGRPHLFHLI